MIRSVLYSVALSGLLIYGVLRIEAVYDETLERRVTRVDIFADRITYRTSSYSSPSLFAIGLKAANDPPKLVALHACERMDDLEAVLHELRSLGYTAFGVQLPESC